MGAACLRQSKMDDELIPLVRQVAGQVARRLPRHVALDDLVSAGMLGMSTALARFDPARATQFKGYAEHRIRGEILDELRRMDPLTRDARAQAKRLAAVTQNLSSTLGREVSTEDVAQGMGVSLEKYHALAGQMQYGTLEEMDCPSEGPDPCEETSRSELRGHLREAINRLPQQQAVVLKLCYYEELSLGEIAAMFAVTPSRICQIRAEAVARLRRLLGVDDDSAPREPVAPPPRRPGRRNLGQAPAPALCS